MQKRIWSLILVLALIPAAFFFGACGKSTRNNLSTLDDQFYALATDYDNFVYEDGVLKISLSNHKNLKNVVSASSNQYKYINNIPIF